MSYAQIEASELVDGLNSDGIGWSEDENPSVRISYPDNENGYDQEYRCSECGEQVTRASDDSPWLDENMHSECGHADSHTVELNHPQHWLNSARISVSDDGVTCSVSVGDPRGAFAFTVRRLNDGRLIMHTPYPGESMPHMKLTEMQPGTYLIED